MREKRAVYCSVAAISAIQALQNTIPPVLERIQAHYPQASVNAVQMLTTAPCLLAMAVAVASGWLVTRVSKKKLLVFAGGMAGIVGLLPLLADSFPLLLAARALYGVPMGLSIALNTAVIADAFQGEDRVAAMGFQAITIGVGMMLMSTVSGFLGRFGFRYSCFLSLTGFLSAAALSFLLPDAGVPRSEEAVSVRPTPAVLEVSVFAVLEFVFLTAYNTNIAMHLSGPLANSSTAAGMLTGIFCGAQIPAGLALKRVGRALGRYTIPFAMACFSAGGTLLILFPGSFPPLALGSLLCGLSQGFFVPQSMVDASNAVPQAAAAMAAACVTCANCFGQLASPGILNAAAGAVFGRADTGGAFTVAVAGMLLSALLIALRKNRLNHHNGRSPRPNS